MSDLERIQEIKDRIAERYTSAEFAEYVDIKIEDLIELFWDDIPDWLIKEVE